VLIGWERFKNPIFLTLAADTTAHDEATTMGREKISIDTTTVLAMRQAGKNIKEIAGKFNVSEQTISRHLAELKENEGILTKYRELQGLRLTELEFHILEAVTPKRIEESSLTDLIKAYYVLSKAEAAIRGKDSFKIKGLVSYLMELERIETGRNTDGL
jgi:DNA-binding transcriptional ArsR family regulator